MTLCKVGASLADCTLLGAATLGLLPPPATAAPGETPANRQKAAALLLSASFTQFSKLFSPLIAFALGAFGGVALQYRIGFHSTALPMGILLVLLVSAWAPHPDEAQPTAATLIASPAHILSPSAALGVESQESLTLSPVDTSVLHKKESSGEESANLAVAFLPAQMPPSHP